MEEYLDLILEKGSQEDMEKLGDLFIDMADYICEQNKEMYHDIKSQMYEMLYGKEISEEMAKQWVSKMIPAAKWSMDDTTNAMRSMGYNLNPIEFYVVANMLYSDYGNVLRNDERKILEMAKDWLSDTDVGKEKLYNYGKYIAKVL